MNSNDNGGSRNFARFIKSRVSRFGRFGLSKKYKEVLMTPLSDEQRSSVIEKLRQKGLPPRPGWSKLKDDSQSEKKLEETDVRKVTFEKEARETIYLDPADTFIEDLLSSAPSSPTMSERQLHIRPGTLGFRMDDKGTLSDVSQSAPSSPSIETGYYDTIPLLPECRNDSREFFHPTNVPFKSFFPFQGDDHDHVLPQHLENSMRFIVDSEDSRKMVKGNFHLRSGKVQSLSQLMEKLQIKHLGPIFQNYGIDDLRAFTKINDHMLEKMKISCMEVKTKILTAIELLSETEDSPEDPQLQDSEQVELSKRKDQRETSEVGSVSNTFFPKDPSQHISRSHRHNKELKVQGPRKSSSLTPSRASSSQRKYQQNKKFGASNQRLRTYHPPTFETPHCKEPTIIHQHIHHHHHVGSSSFSGPPSIVPSLPQLEWKYNEHFDRESIRTAVDTKLLMETINITEYPYSDQNGASGIPLRLVERYAYELDADIRDVAIAFEIIRCDKLLERNRAVQSNMDAILSYQFLNCDGIKTESLENFLVSIGLPMYVNKIKQKKCRNLQTLLLYSDEALCRNFCIHPSHVRWIRREASFFPTGFLSHISHNKQSLDLLSQRFRTSSDAKYFALDRV